MMLQSNLFRDDVRLNACSTADTQHVLSGSKGVFVARIQTAVLILGVETIAGQELQDSSYGPTTARAVLLYKRDRAIINPAYQQSSDNIVGKMTIQRLDQEMLAFEMRARMANIPV